MESWIPEAASDAFDLDAQAGSYFFAAKVKAAEVTFLDRQLAWGFWRQRRCPMQTMTINY